MSKTRNIAHQSKFQRKIVTSSLEILKNREDGHISLIVKMQLFLEIEANIDNLLTSVQFSSVSVILCLHGKIGVMVTNCMFLDERLSVHKNVTAVLLFGYREQFS